MVETPIRGNLLPCRTFLPGDLRDRLSDMLARVIADRTMRIVGHPSENVYDVLACPNLVAFLTTEGLFLELFQSSAMLRPLALVNAFGDKIDTSDND